MLLTDYHLDAAHRPRGARDAARPPRRRSPAALITADRDPGIRAAAEAAGYRLLHKPVRPGALRALLAQLLAERAAGAAE